MTPTIAILTYNRRSALKKLVDSIKTVYGNNVQIGIFDDASDADDTREYLTSSAKYVRYDKVKDAHEFCVGPCSIFLATKNLGVAANSNRALDWFMSLGDAQYLCLCNDDVIATEDFYQQYVNASEQTGLEHFCFCNFDSPQYAWKTIEYRGIRVKCLSRMTGCMLFVTKKVVSTVGFFDTKFNKFGEEHVDYTNRVSLSGLMAMHGEDQYCLDVEGVGLDMQHVPSSIPQERKPELDALATQAMNRVGRFRPFNDLFVPYSLCYVENAGGRDAYGIPTDPLKNYANI